jgi:hypothetical protein
MLILKGVQRKIGVFQGNSYDNYILHCLDTTPFSSDSSRLVCGSVCESIKVRSSEIRNIFGGLIGSDSDFDSLLGYSVCVSYDRYGRPVQVSFSETLEDAQRKGV